MPCSPRADRPRPSGLADSPQRIPAGAAGPLAPASRTRSIGRGRGAAVGSGSGGGEAGGAHVAASLDSAAFRRAVREEAEATPSLMGQVRAGSGARMLAGVAHPSMPRRCPGRAHAPLSLLKRLCVGQFCSQAAVRSPSPLNWLA